jgi:hypothetical protein
VIAPPSQWIPEMTAYVNPFTGQTIQPSSVSYEKLSIGANTALEWPINGNNSTPAASIIEVTATLTSLSLALPPATQVSPGQTVLVRNTGAITFNVTDNIGNPIVALVPGVSQYIYLTDNTTIQGLWASVTLGAGTSAANAADLAGEGLVAVGSTLNQSYPVTNLFSNYAFALSDRSTFFVWESGAGTLTLPSSSIVPNNWFVMIRNNGTGILTLAPRGTDTVDGAASAQLQITESLVLVANGSGFNTFGYGRSNTFFFTQLVKNITGGAVTLTAAEAANVLQEYQGALTSNATVTLPQTVQLYGITNNTTGAFALAFTTGAVGGASVTVATGQTAIVVSDGTNLHIASGSSSSGPSTGAITLPHGAQSALPLNFVGDLTTGMFLSSTGQLSIVAGGVLVATFTATGILAPVGISGGTF